MNPKIPIYLRSTVIELYLQGLSRNEIASRTGISQGAVSNIINEFKAGLGQPLANDLRELAISLRKLRITAPECASGLRVASILQKLGVAEDDLASFISETYNQCREIGLSPDKLAQNVKEFIELCQSVPLSQISDHIKQRKSEKTKLEGDIIQLREEEARAKHDLEKAEEEKKAFISDVKQFCEVKTELEKVGLAVDNIPQFAKAMQGFRKFDYNVERAVSFLTNLDSAYTVQAILERNVTSWNSHLTRSKAEAESWDRLVATQRHKALLYDELDELGFGISELRTVSDTIKEIAAEERIPENVAATDFFRDIKQNYERCHYYQSRVEKMSAELNSLGQVLSCNREVAKSLMRLTLRGYSDKQILNFATILQTHSVDAESFAEDLRKYGSLNKAIQGLSQQRSTLNEAKCTGTTSSGWIKDYRGEGSRRAGRTKKVEAQSARHQ